jgi:invasion protein IalB
MQLTEPEHVQRRRSRSGQGGGSGSGALNILSGLLLIVLGALIAVVVGVLTGVVSPGQLVGLSTGVEASAAPDPPPQPASAVETVAPVPAATPTPPADPQARVARDETFGDWRFVCLEPDEGATASCSASQRLRVAETGAAVFVWRIVQDGQGGLVGIWQVPETVLLAAGLTLDAGTPQPLTIPFESCGGGSCQAVANLAPDFIEKLSSAQTLSASVVLTNRQTVKFPLSPTGLPDALAALSP